MTSRLARLLLLLALALSTSPLRAENYAARDDVRDFIADMHTRHGFDAAELSALFAATKPVAAAIKLIMPPKDPKIRSWRTYRSRFVEPKRIAAGRRFIQTHESVLQRAEQQFGVPAEIIVAVIGVETIYGKHMGSFGTFAALTTLAFDYPPRAPLFRKELEALLLLARDERRKVTDYTGSYAGALGLPQFLPSSIRNYAIDFDADDHIDLTRSVPDAIGSVGRFLAEHGWVKGGPIALTVDAVGDGVGALVAEGILPRRTPADMESASVTLTVMQNVGAGDTAKEAPTSATEGGIVPVTDNRPEQPAALIDLVTPDAPTEYRLGYQNFYVITRYNRSSFYASAVMDLAAALNKQP